MIYIMLLIIFIFSTWWWGDWRNWKLYHSTILYFLYGDMVYRFFTFDHYPLWIHRPVFPFETFSVVAILIQLNFASTTLIYLSRYPKKRSKALLWMGAWVLLYSTIEGVFLLFGLMKHYNGWNLLYSVLFNCIMFPMLRLHFKRPLLAYFLSVIITVVLLIIMKVPLR